MRRLAILIGVQGINFLVPLLLLSILARRLGPAGWGKIALLVALSTFALAFLEYAFHLSGVRAVARLRGIPRELAALFSEVVAAKCMLALLFALPATVLFAVLFEGQLTWAEYLWWLLASLAQAQTPAWFYQGLDRPEVGFGLEALARLGAGLLSVVFVQAEGDVWLYFAFMAVSWLLIAGASWIHQSLGRNIRSVQWTRVRQALASGKESFLLNCYGAFFTAMPAVVLSRIAGLDVVGLYSAADRLVRALYGGFVPVQNHLFPKVAFLVRKDRGAAASIVQRGLVGAILGGCVIAALLYALAPTITPLILGERFAAAATVLRVFASMPMLLVLNTILVVQWMVNCGAEAVFNRCNLILGMLKLAGVAIFGYSHGAAGAAAAVVVCDALCLALVFLLLRRRGLSPWQVTRA